jgi:hypothetical protein
MRKLEYSPPVGFLVKLPNVLVANFSNETASSVAFPRGRCWPDGHALTGSYIR